MKSFFQKKKQKAINVILELFDDCIITQRGAFNRYKRGLRKMRELTVGLTL